MSKKATRQQGIISLLTEQPTLRISEIAQHLDVTTETIRRDFRELTEMGRIDRMYGGALLRPGPDSNVAQRSDLLIDERSAIARQASQALGDVQTIMMGSGATTIHAARRIALDFNNITVIVHSIGAAAALAANPTINVLMAPGIYHAGEGAMHGVQTVEFLDRYNADWCILSASGIAPDGPSDALIEGAEVYSAMIRRSQKCMVLVDSSKFNRLFVARYADWSEVDLLVSNQSPSGDLRKAIELANSKIIVDEQADLTDPQKHIPTPHSRPLPAAF
ncbi:DeoR/GlpR family DNA-binding transcription regulator [Mesorhizobium sp. M0204]|uniref:DeoR/GlpR family DNA-binding transcription regulator n=1 Tax=Mesorhizobium sp. M0204 TaxID=2956913 RepID=UPI003339036B